MVIIHTEPGNDSECCLVDQVAQLAAFLKMAQAPLKPSPQLAEVLGSATPISRPQVAKKVWAYIKKHKLQDPKKRREIVADEKLKPVFGKARLDMFQMTKAISKHLSK